MIQKSGEFTAGRLNNMPSLTISGPFDFVNPKLDALVEDLIEKGEKSIVLDLSQSLYFTSRGMATMFKMIKKIRSSGGRLHITGATEDMKEVIELGRINEFISYVTN